MQPTLLRIIELHGAAAGIWIPGDRIMIMAYGQFEPEEAANPYSTVIFVDQKSKMIESLG